MDAFATYRLENLLVADESDCPSRHSINSTGSAVEISDEGLLDQICNGGREALAILFGRHARAVRGISYRILRDGSEAEDMLQEVFLSVHRDCKTFDGSKASARFWILQIAYRRAISRRRYLTTRHFYTRLDLDDAAVDLIDTRTSAAQLENSISEMFENGQLKKVFGALSENQRETLDLFFREGYSFDEIATRLGQSRGNVKHHYFRAVEKLRKELFGGKLPGERAV